MHGRHALIFEQFFDQIFRQIVDQVFWPEFEGQKIQFCNIAGTEKYRVQHYWDGEIQFYSSSGTEKKHNVLYKHPMYKNPIYSKSHV